MSRTRRRNAPHPRKARVILSAAKDLCSILCLAYPVRCAKISFCYTPRF